MKIQNLFERDIFRPINGVVKADQLDESSVWQELDEFVVTKELDLHLHKFISAYCDGGGHLGLYRLETQVTAGNGTLKTSGLGSTSSAKEAARVGFDFFKANASRISASIKPGDHDYHLHFVELHNTGPTSALTLSAFVALCSGVLGKPVQQQMVVLGSMSLGGNIVPVENIAESLQVAFDAGAKRILLPMAERERHPDDSRRTVREVSKPVSMRILRMPFLRRSA